jgi:hypothetical protein
MGSPKPVKRSCDQCGQWLTAELKERKLKITRDADQIPIRRDETCPNCGVPWELWFYPNGELAKPHGAWSLGGNKVRCVKCDTEAKVSLD